MRLSNDVGAAPYDVAIIGCGVSGANVARRLSLYRIRVAILEKAADVSFGTSTANSGIVHGGFHHNKKYLKARLEIRGNLMFDQLWRELDFPFKRCGIIVAALHEDALWHIASRTDGNCARAYVVNAAGLFADEMSRIFGGEEFSIKARKGEYFLMDKLARSRPERVIFPRAHTGFQVIIGSGDIGLIMARRMSWVGCNVKAVIEIMPYPAGLTQNIVQYLNDFSIPLYLST
jgi:L-2-hydroxyglutarate oxidase LhgO